MDLFATSAEMARALRKRQVSSVELVKASLARLDRLGRAHRAVVRLLESEALHAAKQADRRIARGRPLGPLDGVPFAVKDMFATAGIPTTWGSPAHQNQAFPFDATVIKRLKRAGAVLVAKLAMIELAGGGNYNMPGASATGACLCAHDPKRWAGGSSSGSGACVGLGCVPFALGSETWGSITCPCAFNGVTGLRPTYGRVSRFGAMALGWTHDKIGPLARSVEDCATVLSAIVGPDPNDPTCVHETLNLTPPRRKLRIGLLKERFKDNHADRCEKAYLQAVETFRSLGYNIVEVAYPDLPYATAMELIIGAEGASAHENFLRSERVHKLLDKDQVAGLLASFEIRATDYLWALRLRTQALKANDVWTKCDAIFTPVFYHAAPPAEGKFSDTWKNMGGDDGPSNLLGWPAVAFPIGMDDALPALSAEEARKQGFKPAPLGGQLIGPAFAENVIVKIASHFQHATQHHLRRPAGA